MASTETSPLRTLMSLPDDLLQRLLVGVPLEDHRAAASACVAFRDVINGPKFLALRRRYGFAERGVVIVGESMFSWVDVVEIRIAGRGLRGQSDPTHPYLRDTREDASKSGVMANIRHVSFNGSTTDGGSRLFVSTTGPGAPNQIVAVDVPSRRWKRLASMPLNQIWHCLQWHDGLLYVAGGDDRTVNPRLQGLAHCHALNSLHAFNELTGSWEKLPPMPHACLQAASGVIGNQLFIAGGYSESERSLRTLQIYDIATRTWRVGAPLPKSCLGSNCGVVDGKLLVANSFHLSYTLIYDPRSDSWTEEAAGQGLNSCLIGGVDVEHSCAHNGRLVAFTRHGGVFERDTDGLWSRGSCGVNGEGLHDFVSESVLLG